MIDSSAVYAVIFFRSFVFLRINFSHLPFSRRVRGFLCATSRRGADAASFEAKVNSAMFSADKVSRCAILSNAFMRVWPSGKAKASQAFIRGFESRHPLQVYASRRWVSVGGFLFRGECSSSPVVARSVYVVSNGVGGFSSMLYASDFCVLVLRFHFKRTRAVFKRGRYSAVLDRGLRQERMQHAARRKPLL